MYCYGQEITCMKDKNTNFTATVAFTDVVYREVTKI